MTRTLLRYLCALAVAVALTAVCASAFATPTLPPIAPASQPGSVAALDDTARHVLDLQASIADVQAEQVAIDNRIAVTSRLIVEQTDALDRVNSELATAQAAFDERAVALYKFGGFDTLGLLLDARSWDDLVARSTLLASMLESDRQTLEEAAIVASQAQFQAGQLEALRAQDVELRNLKDTRARILESALAEEQTLLSLLSPAGRVVYDARQQQNTSTRAQWAAASIPIGTPIPKVAGRVLPSNLTYLVSQYHYRTYRATGVAYNAVASWYGADFNGLGTASGETYNMDDFTCAHKTLPFGTWLAVTRHDPLTKKDRRIVVVVNDRGPFVSGRDFDLSKAAAEALGMASAGVATIDVEEVTPVTN